MSMDACKAKCLLLPVCSFVSYSNGGNCVLYKSKTSNSALYNNVVSSGTLLQRTRWREAHDVRLAAKYATVDAPAGKEECRQRCGKDSSQCPFGFLFEHQRCSSSWVTRPVSSATALLPDSCVQKVYATIELCKAMCAADAQCRENGFIHTVQRFGFSSPSLATASALAPSGAAFWTSKTDDERAVCRPECLNHKGVGWRAMTMAEAGITTTTAAATACGEPVFLCALANLLSGIPPALRGTRQILVNLRRSDVHQATHRRQIAHASLRLIRPNQSCSSCDHCNKVRLSTPPCRRRVVSTRRSTTVSKKSDSCVKRCAATTS